MNWCLYEVMDNVFQQSRASSGFVMMQIHRTSRMCVITVGDTGIGIQRPLLDGSHHGKTDRSKFAQAHSAMDLAVQQGVTSKGTLNQGIGLFGVKRKAEINGGELRIISGRGVWSIHPSAETGTDLFRPVLDLEWNQATTADWQLDCSRPVRIQDAPGAPHAGGDFLEAIETPDGHHRVAVIDLEQSLGSRAKGAEVRTRLLNYLQAGARFIVFDFAGVGGVSSSLADQVLGKLAIEMGELEFRRRIFVDGASPTNRSLIETAISRRLSTDA
ncbi:ATP-binding protein [Cryobacterium sp. TMB3-1-2]|uniref:ATP-binding protein n=1 Tax=Cryobacterium sp. TMB3-1-2 TaxID=1259208 RepID=UPI00351A7167